MKKRLSKIVVLIFISIWISREGEPAGASFLRIGIGAKAASLGEAYTALADNVTAIYWNPAGLARLNQPEVNVMHSKWLADINYEFIGLTYPLEDIIVASALSYLDTGKIEETTLNPPYKTGNTFEANNMVLSLAVAQRLQDVFMGAGFKIIHQRIAQEKTDGYAMDFGLLYKNFGLSVQNLGTNMKFIKKEFSFPTIYRAGMAINKKHFTFTSDISKTKDTNLAFSTGLEVWFGKIMALRFGWRVNNNNTKLGKYKGIPTGFTSGFGIKPNDSVDIDYCFTPYGEVEETHRLSLGIKFKPKEIEPVQKQEKVELPVEPETESKTSEASIIAGDKGKASLTARVLMDRVTIWQEPDSNSPPIAKVNKGTVMQVLDTSKKWYYKIMLPDGKIGWINANFIELNPR